MQRKYNVLQYYLSLSVCSVFDSQTEHSVAVIHHHDGPEGTFILSTGLVSDVLQCRGVVDK